MVEVMLGVGGIEITCVRWWGRDGERRGIGTGGERGKELVAWPNMQTFALHLALRGSL